MRSRRRECLSMIAAAIVATTGSTPIQCGRWIHSVGQRATSSSAVYSSRSSMCFIETSNRRHSGVRVAPATSFSRRIFSSNILRCSRFVGAGSVSMESAQIGRRFMCISNSQEPGGTTSTTTAPSPSDHETRKYYYMKGETLSYSKAGVSAMAMKSPPKNTDDHATPSSQSSPTKHTLLTDIPKQMGGQDLAPQPVETLLAAWMGCTQATALFVARHLLSTHRTSTASSSSSTQRLVLDRLEFTNIKAWRDERGALDLPILANQPPDVPSRLQEITGTIRVFVVPAGKRRKDDNDGESFVTLDDSTLESLKEQTEWRCPVANMMIASGCQINVEWVNGVVPGE
mmetsp:Transcript_24523/g.67897  ORF Transcript_24523/g.67897 Transcript_24523/m.67897 type:complete len:343 (-) Transcript_24523:227-1255(-)